MKDKLWSIIVIGVVLVAVTVILYIKISTPKIEFPMPKKGEVTITEIGSTLCIPCKKLRPVIFEQQKIYEGKATVNVIEISNEVKDAYKVDLIPTVIIFDQDTNEVERRIVTEEEVDQIPSWIKEIVTKLGVK